MSESAIRTAMLLEKAQKIKDQVAQIDRLAGTDDAKFRKLILGYFRPDLKAEVKMERRD